VIPETELILNPDGSVYHLNLRPEDLADTILTVGDPDRVPLVSRHFDRIDLRKQKREFVTHTGYLGARRLTVISSGIGTDNVEILMNELDALVNVDLETRTVRPVPRSLQFIRLGTSGSLRPELGVDSLVASVTGTGLDSLQQFYRLPQTEVEHERTQALQRQLGLSWQPYQATGSEALRLQLAYDFTPVHTLTCPGFYAPQGRFVRLAPRLDAYLDNLLTISSTQYSIDNFEMETAGYYAFGRLLGHAVLSLSVILASRRTGQFSPNPERATERLLTTVLERLASA
jgi:uridine phosphorylase